MFLVCFKTISSSPAGHQSLFFRPTARSQVRPVNLNQSASQPANQLSNQKNSSIYSGRSIIKLYVRSLQHIISWSRAEAAVAAATEAVHE